MTRSQLWDRILLTLGWLPPLMIVVGVALPNVYVSVVGIILLVVTPPKWDPAIQMKEKRLAKLDREDIDKASV